MSPTCGGGYTTSVEPSRITHGRVPRREQGRQFLPKLGQGIAHRQGQTATEGAEGTRFQGVEGVSVLAAIL